VGASRLTHVLPKGSIWTSRVARAKARRNPEWDPAASIGVDDQRQIADSARMAGSLMIVMSWRTISQFCGAAACGCAVLQVAEHDVQADQAMLGMVEGRGCRADDLEPE
jgi:hypothetical protein